jgi:hypothetical protein
MLLAALPGAACGRRKGVASGGRSGKWLHPI